EPGAWERLAVADAADHGVGAELDVREADRRMAVGVVVGELRALDELDAWGIGLAQEQRGELFGSGDRVRHHDQHAGDVARGHDPLLAVYSPAVAGRDRGAGDAARVRARL